MVHTMSYATTPDSGLTGITVPEGADSPPGFVAAMQALGLSVQAQLDDLWEVLAGEWHAYVPTWTASISDPSIGNGHIAGRYRLVGKTCVFTASVTVGSTSDMGSGYYRIGLPLAPLLGDPGNGVPEQRAHVDVRAPSQGDPAPRWIGNVRLYSQTPDMTIHYDSGGDNDGRVCRFTATEPLPGGMQDGDVFTVWGTYETA